MIDFRYHLVSLIAVFLALAIGVILGAGPLKEAIGDQLTGQVSQLREDKQALRDELDRTLHNAAGTDEFLRQSATDLIGGTLAERRIVLIATGAVDSAANDAVAQSVEEAGGEIVGRIGLLESWYSSELSDARQSYAASLSDYLSPATASGTYDQVLGRALALAFSGSADPLGEGFSAEADLVRDILISGDLIQVIAEPVVPADAYILVEPTLEVSADPLLDNPDAALLREQSSVLAQTADSLARSSEATVVVGFDESDGTVISAIRNSDAVAATVSTVTGSDTVVGQFSTVLALSEQMTRHVGHYGVMGSEPQFPRGARLSSPQRDWMTALGSEPSPPQSSTADTSGDETGAEAESSDDDDARDEDSTDDTAADPADAGNTQTP